MKYEEIKTGLTKSANELSLAKMVWLINLDLPSFSEDQMKKIVDGLEVLPIDDVAIYANHKFFPELMEGIKCLIEIGNRKEAIKISTLMNDVM